MQTVWNVSDDEVLIRNNGKLTYSNGFVMLCFSAIRFFQLQPKLSQKCLRDRILDIQVSKYV